MARTKFYYILRLKDIHPKLLGDLVNTADATFVNAFHRIEVHRVRVFDFSEDPKVFN